MGKESGISNNDDSFRATLHLVYHEPFQAWQGGGPCWDRSSAVWALRSHVRLIPVMPIPGWASTSRAWRTGREVEGVRCIGLFLEPCLWKHCQVGGSVKKTYLFERVSWREKEIEIGREGRRGREKETPSFCWSTPQMAMLGQSQEFLPGLPCGCRGPKTWAILCFLRLIRQGAW